MTGCRIGKVTFKDKKIVPIPSSGHAVYVIDLGWGEVVFRCYDGAPIKIETLVYMLRAIEDEIIRG